MRRSVLFTLIVLLLTVGLSPIFTHNVYALGKTTVYTVTFLYGNKSTVVEVEEGENAKIPTDTSINGYSFLGWNGDASNIHSDTIILGMYTCNTPYAPSINSTTTVKKINDNTSATFLPWWPESKGVPGKSCVLRWYSNIDSQPFRSDVVKYGDSLSDPADPSAEGYTFIGWEGSWKNVTEDRAIKAYFEKTENIDSLINENYDDLVAKLTIME